MAFYSEDILNVKDGKFGKIWMASHKMTKLTRREVAGINVSQCCEDVLEYIETRQGERRGRHGRRYPRLSLYLSSYLMYGVTIIYNKQCEYLLADAESIFVSVGHLPTLTEDKTIRRETAVTNPEYDLEFEMDYNYFAVMEEAGKLQEKLPSAETWTLGYTLLRSPQRSARKSKTKKRKSKASEPSLEVRREDITLPEREELPSRIDPVMSPQISKDDDFQSRIGQDLEINMMPPRIEDLISASTPRQPPAPQDTTDRPSRTRKKSQQTTLESPTRIQQSVVEKTPAVMPPLEEMPVAQAAPSESLDITIPMAVEEQQEKRPRRKQAKRSLHLDQFVRPASPEVASKRKKRKQKVKIVTDKIIQIPKLQIRKNLETGIQTSSPFMIPENTEYPTVTDLMKIQGRRELRREPFSQLWSRGAVFRRNIRESDLPAIESPESGQSLSERSVESAVPEISGIQPPEIQPQPEVPLGQRGSSEEEMLIATRLPEDLLQLHHEPRTAEESIEILRQTSASMTNLDISTIEMPSVERVRDADASGLMEAQALNISDIPPAPDSSQKTKGSASKRKSRSISSRKSADGSIELEQAPSYTSLHTSNTSGMDTRGLYNIEEERIEIPIHTEMVGNVREEEAILLAIQDASTEGRSTFREMCPPEHFTRQEAVSWFTALIGLCTKGTVKASQRVCFGDIYIVME